MRSLFFISFFLCGIALRSQPAGYAAVKNPAGFQQSLQAATGSVKTVTASFTQVKNLAMLKDKLKSTGKFYLKKDDKVRIEYTAPYTYLVVLNAGRMMVKDEQKSSKVNTRGSKTMQSLNRVLLDCMRGTPFSNPDFKTTAYEGRGGYALQMNPATADMAKLFSRIEVYLDRATFDVKRLSMSEPGGDFTDMTFSGTVHNQTLGDALFSVR